MPLPQRWSKYKKENVSNAPNTFGVYEIANSEGEIVYIGQGNIRRRLNDHFLGGSDPIPPGAQFRFAETRTKLRAEQRERAELNQYERDKGELPRHNKRQG